MAMLGQTFPQNQLNEISIHQLLKRIEMTLDTQEMVLSTKIHQYSGQDYAQTLKMMESRYRKNIVRKLQQYPRAKGAHLMLYTI